VAEINARFGRVLVEKGQGLNLLFQDTKLSTDLENTSLPSWAPEWTKWRAHKDSPLNLALAYSGDFYNRIISTSHISLVDGELSALRVSGFRLDSGRQSILKFPRTDSMNIYDRIPDLKIFFEQSKGLLSGDPYFTGESWQEVGCRTLLADHLPKKRAFRKS